MSPRVEVRLDRVERNAALLVGRLGLRGIGVTAVTKATLGSPEVATVLLRAGATGLGESRVENAERLRAAGIGAPITLVRAPMPSQVDRVVAVAEVSCNTEPATLELLSAAALAQGRRHGVLLMVELGDLREGILPADLPGVVAGALALPGLEVRGIGTNLACQHGIVPDAAKMAELSALADELEARFAIRLGVSGGNSANLDWALGPAGAGGVGRIDDLRLGEALLLGREPLQRTPIEGLHLDAFTLVAEVIEARAKPSLAWGDVGETAFGPAAASVDRGTTTRVLVAIGRQDVDPDGLTPPAGIAILGASSDHLVLDAGAADPASMPVGTELRFGLDYSALLRAMTSPFVATTHLDGEGRPSAPAAPT